MSRQIVEAGRDATRGATSAYDKAVAVENYLRDSFTYSTQVPTVPPDRDWVEYFLFESKQGYCDYFATAMVILLRTQGVPARIAAGFAPGDLDESTGVSTVRENHAHSWVEVYFPRYGWILFEPSSIRPVPQRIEEAPEPLPVPEVVPQPIDDDRLTLEEIDELLGMQSTAAFPQPERPIPDHVARRPVARAARRAGPGGHRRRRDRRRLAHGHAQPGAVSAPVCADSSTWLMDRHAPPAALGHAV